MEIHRDVACTVCGCVCDDLTVTFDGRRFVDAERACGLARPWFESLNAPPPPVARVRGVEVTREAAVAEAVRLVGASGRR